MRIETANQLSGRAIGAMFFAGFGSGWMFLSLTALQKISAGSATAVGLVTLAPLAASGYLASQAKRWPRMPEDPKMGRVFGWINAIQWIAVGAAVFLCSRLHLDAYVMNAITAIVGLHMFPLARLFKYTPHYVTGAVLVAWSAVSVWMAPVDALQGVAALGTGLILWASAAFGLAIGLQAVRRASVAQVA